MSTQTVMAAPANPVATGQGHLTGYGTRPYRTYVLSSLMFVYILNFVDRGLLSVVGPKLKGDIGISDTWWGLLTGAAFAVLYTLVGIPLARVSERRHRIWIMTICIIIWSGFTALCGTSHDMVLFGVGVSAFWMLVIFRIGVGIGEAGCTPPATSIIADYYPPQWRSTALGYYAMGVTLGTVLANLVGGPVTEAYGWRMAFYVLGLPGIAVAIILKLTVKEPPRGYSEPPTVRKTERATWGETFRALGSKPSYWWMVAATTTASFCGYAVANFQSLYLTRTFHMTAGDAALYINAPAYAAGALGTFGTGWLAQKIGARSVSSIAWLPGVGMALCVPFYFLAFTSTGLLLCTFGLAMGHFVKYGYLASQYTIASNVVSMRMRATSAAILIFMQNMLGYSLGPPFAGVVSDFFFGKSVEKANLTGVVTRAMCDAGQSAVSSATAAARKAGSTIDLPAVLAKLKAPMTPDQLTFCNAANADSTQTAMLTISAIYLAGAVCFVFCMLRLKRDFADAVAANAA